MWRRRARVISPRARLWTTLSFCCADCYERRSMNLRALDLTLALLLAIPFAVRSEEPAPKAEAPATTDVDKDKKGAKADAAPLAPVDPMQITGTVPTFPLKTEN